MNDLVTELHILEEGSNIFSKSDEYIIPLYQRAFAWEDRQLIQLIEDINDAKDNDNYYIGSLIVSKQSGKFEVVDGQQRLTSLYLLLSCLDIDPKPAALTFACRDKSNYTLRSIKELLHEDLSKLDMEQIEFGIQRGIKIISQELRKAEFDKKSFIKKLGNVIVYRIEVPDNTDLNRYFEIMNTRGEQLEQHDILKATLMSYLRSDSEKGLFAKIWDACSDMTGYVQMHFISNNNLLRKDIFGSGWNGMPSNDWNDYERILSNVSQETAGHRIQDLIDKNFKVEDYEGYLDEDVRVRFESIIEFPYFLLHTLKVYISLYGIIGTNKTTRIVDDLLDDKKLLEAFNRVVDNGIAEKGIRVADSKELFSRTFILCLLRTRYLFDMYIIKREYANDSIDGEWSLKSLYVSGQQSNKKAYYKNTKLVRSGEWASTNDIRTKTNIMIQSALRVSYTSPKVMHWITKLLIWLSASDCKNIKNESIINFDKAAEEIAIDAVRENFFHACKDGIYAMGVNTPHIVFNYLDYLLWQEDFQNKTKKYSNFAFEFRNSVEHWYPQNPSEGTFEQWKDGVDQFGNLCIIQRNVNSKFSNMSPEAKKSTFKDMIAKGSIKLRIMSSLTEKNGDMSASLYWKKTAYKEHEEKMLEYLRKSCNVEQD